MGKKKKSKKKKADLLAHEEVVSRVKAREESKARAKLRQRIKSIQSEEGYDPYSKAVDSTDRMLQQEIKEVQTMVNFLRTYEGEQPMLLRFRQELLRHSGWVPTPRQRVLFFSILKSRGARGNLRKMGSAEYVKALDGDRYEPDAPEDDGPTSLD